ncbi:MAG: carbohydrate ABC transporter permease [Lachnospiraceae bacterium]|jgi:sn-glycerol 3-phosphate transport system permease protein|nr:carbohydrate ABC transporter permease [Lachnospiraceae bacterium]
MPAKKKQYTIDMAVTVVSLALGCVIVFPVVYCILGAFKTRVEFGSYPPTFFPESFANLDNFQEALDKTPLLRFMLNSLIVALMGTTVRMAFSILAAYAFAFLEFKGKNFLFFFILATMMLPGDTLTITNYLTVSKMNLLDTYLGMCITSFVGASQMFMLRQNFRTIPRALRDASFLDGCGDLRFLWSVVLPMAKPVILTLSVQSFINLWNAYLWPLLVTNKEQMRTVQVGITMLTSAASTNYHLILAAVTLTLIPSFIMFVILRRNIVKGMTAGALVG